MEGKEHEFKSALKVNEGIEQPPQVNANYVKNLKHKRALLSVDEYFKGIMDGNRTILSQAITLVESSLPDHHNIARQLVEKCLPFTGKSIRLGITGVPGAGKSTFIEAFGKFLTKENHKVAVLAIDPSSQRSKGSILGDKTRMEELSADHNAFIRPSPSAGSLGGVARKTRETTVLCEAAGFDIIIIETVGVGQSETAVHSMVDFFLLLMLAGAGDELQGIKRGIMEMADAIVINKADGDNRQQANLARQEYQSALHLFPLPPSGWSPVVDVCSALQKQNIDKVWNIITDYLKLVRANGYFSRKRMEQARNIMTEAVEQELRDRFYQYPGIVDQMNRLSESVDKQQISSYEAARRLIEFYTK